MNNLRLSNHHILFLLLILIALSVGIHFLHDLQPVHLSIFENSSGLCDESIHYVILMNAALEILFAVFLLKSCSAYRQIPRSCNLFAIVPPPIF
jgi:hypothetical protein